MVCKVELLRYGNYNTNADDNLLETITAETDGIVVTKHDNASQSLRVSGCDNTGVTLMEHAEPGNQVMMSVPNGYWSGGDAPSSERPEHAWLLEGEISGIGFELVPEEKIDKGGIVNHKILLPERRDDGYTHLVHDVSCKDDTVCAWYYHPLNTEGGINEYPLTSTGNLTGHPCIHADRGIWLQSGNLPRNLGRPKMSCSYKIDEDVMAALYADTASPNDPRRAVWDNITRKICDENNNILWTNPDFKIGNGKTCWDLKKDKIKTQCVKTKDNRKDGTETYQKNCKTLRESSPKHFTEIVKEYCQSPEGKDDKYCSCINTLENDGTWCDEDENKDFIGCVEANKNFNAMIEAVPEEFKRKFFGTKHCFIDACRSTGDNVYVEKGLVNSKGEVKGCTQNMKICGKYYQMDGTVQGSTITARCEKKAKDDAEWAKTMAAAQETGMKMYLENKEKAKEEEEKAKEQAKEEAKIEEEKKEKKEKEEKEEKMVIGGSILMVVIMCICLAALIYIMKNRR